MPQVSKPLWTRQCGRITAMAGIPNAPTACSTVVLSRRPLTILSGIPSRLSGSISEALGPTASRPRMPQPQIEAKGKYEFRSSVFAFFSHTGVRFSPGQLNRKGCPISQISLKSCLKRNSQKSSVCIQSPIPTERVGNMVETIFYP